jgi:hypothetical protein
VKVYVFFCNPSTTNYEAVVQKTLTHIFEQKKVNLVKTIYALDTHNQFEPSNLNLEDIKCFVHFQKVRQQLNNMRYSYARMKSPDQSVLKDEYKHQIQLLTEELKNEPKLSHLKNKTVLKGYIIIELHGEHSKIPSSIYYDIKSVPKVIGMPSVYNVPANEVHVFTEQLKKIV